MKRPTYIPLALALIILAGSPAIAQAFKAFHSWQIGDGAADGYVLQTDGTNSTWVATSSLGITGGGGSSGIATATPWTNGDLVQVASNGTVKSIATSSLGLPTFSWPFPGNATSTALSFTHGITISGATSNVEAELDIFNDTALTFLGGSVCGNTSSFKTGSDGTFLVDAGCSTKWKVISGKTAGFTDGSFNYLWHTDDAGNTTQSGDLTAQNITANGMLTLPALANLAGSFLAVDGSGKVIATTSPSGGSSFGYPFTPSSEFGQAVSATTTALDVQLPGSGLGFNISSTSWYGLGGKYLLYASSSAGSLFLGFNAGGNQATTSDVFYGANTVIGVNAGASFNGAYENMLLGEGAGQFMTNGHDNAAIGYHAANSFTTGTYSVAIGSLALPTATSSSGNISIGDRSSVALTSGGDNVIIGHEAGHGGNWKENVLIGSQAGFDFATSSNDNTCVGAFACLNQTTGYGNTQVGSAVNPVTITTGHNNISLGGEIFNVNNAASNQLNIGNFLYGTIPATTTAFKLPVTGVFGIGTSSPFAKLSVQTNNGDTTPVLFAIGSSTAAATSTLFEVSNTGKVGVGTTSPAAGLDIYSSTSSSTPLLLEATTGGGCIIIKDVAGTGYTQLYTQAGVVSAKVHTGALSSCN
jgi:hypothetical protein